MIGRVFNTCLNKEEKLYNCSILALFCGAVLLAVGGVIFGLLPGFALSAGGFIGGTWFSTRWHQGLIQRRMYKYFPYSKSWLDKNSPESSDINEI